LTVEDILNVDQRPKVEEFEDYVFITLKFFTWHNESMSFSKDQVSFVLGKNHLISFQEHGKTLFQPIQERLRGQSNQRMRQQGCDYLAYRLMDSVIDAYFIVLENLGDEIENIEELIISNPQPENTQTLYNLKRQLMLLRKSIWPTREAISHLLQMESSWIKSFTRAYLRDLYDHVVQTMDTIETFRDILSSMLDVYLSSITNRMNEVMKTLTIIATIFIPITFITSLYGMNFTYMPELNWHWGYYSVLGLMGGMVLVMLNYFRRKKWL
jgi:magnesium transporter